MPNSTKAKPYKKPRKDFPLFPHANGRWCKKVRGKFCYFGKCADDPNGQAALELWLDQKDDLLAGRTPRDDSDGLMVKDLCNHFLTFKEAMVESGELVQRSYDQYYSTCELMVEELGKRRRVDDLRVADFTKFRKNLAKRFGPVSLGNTIQRVRSIFKYGYEAEIIDKPPRYGPGFKKPSAKTIRTARAKHGVQLFKAEQVRAILDHAMPNTKAMTLLALNGGLGNTDLARMPIKALDLEAGWLDYARAKTGMPRRIPLWPETVKAVKAAIEERSEPNDPADSELVFIGRRGESYVGEAKGYRVAQEFARAMKRAKVTGRAFYDLRRTFQTIGEGANDLVAVQSIMGHAPTSGDMSAVYRQRVDDSRLLKVTNHVRSWLFKKNPKSPKTSSE